MSVGPASYRSNALRRGGSGKTSSFRANDAFLALSSIKGSLSTGEYSPRSIWRIIDTNILLFKPYLHLRVCRLMNRIERGGRVASPLVRAEKLHACKIRYHTANINNYMHVSSSRIPIVLSRHYLKECLDYITYNGAVGACRRTKVFIKTNL